MKQHYTTLGLQEGASQEEIEAAYKRLSKELDPGNNDNQEFFIEEYKKLQQAYKALSASSILATKQGAKNVYSKPKEEKSLKDEPANTKPPKSHTNKTKVIVGVIIGVFIIGILGFIIHYNTKEIQGLQQAFYENGNLKSEAYYYNGEINGDFFEWYSNGNKKSEALYSNGKQIGYLKQWYENGNYWRTVEINENGDWDILISYHKNGRIDLEKRGEYYFFWDENGKQL